MRRSPGWKKSKAAHKDKAEAALEGATGEEFDHQHARLEAAVTRIAVSSKR